VEWNVNGFAGIGIWDLMGDWLSSVTSPWGALRAVVAPGRVLRGPSPRTLERWDTLTQRMHCVAIGEIDNHASKKRLFGISKKVFSFDYAFRTIRTHVLTAEPLSGDAARDRSAIFAALGQGQSYVSFDLWNDPRGFQFEIFDTTQRATMGGEITRRGPLLLEAKLPGPGRIRLIRNGRIIREERSRFYMERDVEMPGVYRLEVEQKVCGRWRPWIYSNPIWVK
jgi:hypothetical protein